MTPTTAMYGLASYQDASDRRVVFQFPPELTVSRLGRSRLIRATLVDQSKIRISTLGHLGAPAPQTDGNMGNIMGVACHSTPATAPMRAAMYTHVASVHARLDQREISMRSSAH